MDTFITQPNCTELCIKSKKIIIDIFSNCNEKKTDIVRDWAERK